MTGQIVSTLISLLLKEASYLYDSSMGKKKKPHNYDFGSRCCIYIRGKKNKIIDIYIFMLMKKVSDL